MNIENVKAAIAIMERAGKVSMNSWQRGATFNARETEEELHMCGNSACFAGWVAVSPEWKEFGGFVAVNGAPIFGSGNSPACAIAHWLEIKEETANLLVHGEAYPALTFVNEDMVQFSAFYDKEWSKVRAKHVIAKLNILLQENGELKLLKQYKKDVKPFLDNDKASCGSITTESCMQGLLIAIAKCEGV